MEEAWGIVSNRIQLGPLDTQFVYDKSEVNWSETDHFTIALRELDSFIDSTGHPRHRAALFVSAVQNAMNKQSLEGTISLCQYQLKAGKTSTFVKWQDESGEVLVFDPETGEFGHLPKQKNPIIDAVSGAAKQLNALVRKDTEETQLPASIKRLDDPSRFNNHQTYYSYTSKLKAQ